MTAYIGKSRRIKDALKTIIATITYDTGSGSEPAFVSVLDNTKDAFDGYPAVRILPNTINSQTGTNTQRDHTVSFAVILSLPLEDPSNVEAAVYNQMYDLTDLIIDTLEHADFIQQLTTIDATVPYFKMDVTNNQWRVATGKTGGMLFANITAEITYSKDAS